MGYPSGVIIIWPASAIPAGWVLCDGANGTPNLVGRYPRGADSSTYPVDATAGAATLDIPAHTHAANIQPISSGGSTAASGTTYASRPTGHTHSLAAVTTDSGGLSGVSLYPASYGASYIMKI